MGKDKGGGGDSVEIKISTVDIESVDNMATLPVGQHRGHGSDSAIAEKHNNANKEMELKSVQSKPSKRTSLFIITSFIYAKLLVVICIAYVISDVITHSLPLYYYEGFFTYLYGMSILFLLYVFCFLLQESSCCNGSPPKPKPAPKEKKPKKEKEKKPKEKKKEKEGKDAKKEGKDAKKEGKDKKDAKDKDSKKQSHQEVYPRKMRDKVREQRFLSRAPFFSPAEVPPPQVPPPQVPPPQLPPPQQDIIEIDVEVAKIPNRRRKTSQNDHSHGSFFLRIGAIAFGLGTMIYTGLEFGTFFEVPFNSPCYMILRGVNPLLQMIFTFMQMYFIFMNSRLNIHRFKVIARFGLMHIVATNLCVWIRTLVIESMKELTQYSLLLPLEDFAADGVLRSTQLRGGKVLGGAASSVTTAATTLKAYAGKQIGHADATTSTTPSPYRAQGSYLPSNKLLKAIKSTAGYGNKMGFREPNEPWFNDEQYSTRETTLLTTNNPLRNIATKLTEGVDGLGQWIYTTAKTYVTSTIESTTSPTTTTTTLKSTTQAEIWGFNSDNTIYRVDEPPHSADRNATEIFESFDSVNPAALLASAATNVSQSCGRVNIMGTIVQDSTPYLYPFIIEYSLIGAAVIYVMWKHIGSSPSTIGDEDLEKRLEAVLSRRAAALAAARRGNRVDCAGASKGLFCGLLLLVAALICLILFFVLIRQLKLRLLAIYLADVSHCALMALSILAIFIGFIRISLMTWKFNNHPEPSLDPLNRVRSLKFRSEEQSDLNDILLRVSAFGLFTYAVFSVIAGSLGAFTSEPNLLVMITGILAVVQVVLQLLFIADVSRRRVHLPEQERSKPARQVVTFLLICNLTMWLIYTFEAQKVVANPVQLEFYGFLAWSLVQRITLPLCIFHRFHSAVTLAEIWKTSYKARLE